MYDFVLTTVELYKKLNFQKENINNPGLDDKKKIIILFYSFLFFPLQ